MANTTTGAAREPSTTKKSSKQGSDAGGVKRLLSTNGSKGKPPSPRRTASASSPQACSCSRGPVSSSPSVVVRNESAEHGQPFEWSDFMAQFFASTFENWQSEFLQLVWQAAGLSLLLFWGSSQSKESDERIEVKIDRLLEEQGIDPASIQRAGQPLRLTRTPRPPCCSPHWLSRSTSLDRPSSPAGHRPHESVPRRLGTFRFSRQDPSRVSHRSGVSVRPP